MKFLALLILFALLLLLLAYGVMAAVLGLALLVAGAACGGIVTADRSEDAEP